MKRTHLIIAGLLVLLLAGLTGQNRPEPATSLPDAPTPEQQKRMVQTLGQLPLYFIENQGQLDEQVAYYVQGSDTTVYFTTTGVTIAQTTPAPPPASPLSFRGVFDEESSRPWSERFLAPQTALGMTIQSGSENTNTEAQRWSVKLEFVGANPDVQPVGEGQTEAIISYFKGQPEEWHTGLPTFSRVVYPDLWPDIDLVYEGSASQLKYTFIVQPGADPAQIQLAYQGATDVTLNAAGQLKVQTPLGGFTDDTPVAYQEVDGMQIPIEMAYALNNATASNPRPRTHTGKQNPTTDTHLFHFEIGPYDPALPLILDPVVLLYAGYIGGSGNDYASAIAVDGSGNAYVTGYTTSTEDQFPVLTGPDLTYNGGTADAFVAKVNSSGSALVYAGYIGGAGDDNGNSIAVDGFGNAYITGNTESSEATFPVLLGPDLTYNGGIYDAFVVKVNSSGTALVYAGYIGGSDGDIGYGIAVDGSGNAYITGATESSEATFPVLVGPGLTYNGGRDAFVAKVNNNAALVYAGYIGGSNTDEGLSIAVDGSVGVYIVGHTTSTEASFPVLVGPDLIFNGAIDAFVAKVNNSSALVYAGYIGGLSHDYGIGIAVDGSGNAYVTGYTESSEATFPVLVGPDLTFNGSVDAFVAKVNISGSSLVYAGYIGGSGGDYGWDIAIDGSGNAYITGYTASTEATFPVLLGPDLTFNGGWDAFVAKVNSSGSTLVHAGYIGGSGTDRGRSIAIDGSGNTYITGNTVSTQATFPVLVGPDLTFNVGWDAFVVKMADIGSKVFLPALLNNHTVYFEGPVEQEPNNGGDQANGPLRLGREYQGRPNDMRDYFTFNLDTAVPVTVNLNNHVGEGLQLVVFHNQVGNIAGSDNTPPYQVALPNAQPGKYYILIFATGGYADSPLYRLTVNAGSDVSYMP